MSINGTGFTGATGVSFGTVAASSFTVNSDTSITAMAPTQAAGTFDVTVTTFGGTSSTGAADQFTYTAAATPAITGLTPTTGTTAGGTTVLLYGSGFTSATGVNFGTLAALSYTVISDTSITAVSPMAAAGQVDIRVTTYAGTSAVVGADKFTYTNITTPAPAIIGVSPNTGSTAGGQIVTITGTNFTGTTGVTFATGAATSYTVLSDTQILATAPVGPAGTWDTRVITNNGTSAVVAADQFTYLAIPAPGITNPNPNTGTTAGGTSVVITGTNFTGATAVSFDGIPAAGFTVNSATQITATSPPLPAGTMAITVTTPSGVSNSSTFTVTAAAVPTVTSLGTTSGTTAGGTSVTIYGTSFTGATGVFFEGVPAASFSVVSSTQITATSPPQYAGNGDITVATYAGLSATVSGDQFTYTAASTPAVTSLGTTSGTTGGGTSVTIYGTNFTGATGVFFEGVPAASFSVVSSTQISATSPGQTAGLVDVQVVTTAGASAPSSGDLFTYINASVPTVTSLGTSTGTTAGSTNLTIYGSGFTGALAVTFGSVPAAGFTVVSDTQITATSPAQAAGTVDVTVTTYSGTSAPVSGDHFTYTNAATPVVSGITPNSGSTVGGTQVTVYGSGFTGATAVNFGTSSFTTDFTVLSDTALVVTAPWGTAGTFDVTVTTFSGTSTTSSADLFTYTAATAPTVTSLSPTSESTGGGTIITITGTGFLNATGVNFNGSPASSFWILSDTQITAMAPPLSAGTWDATVMGNGLTSALSTGDRFTATFAPAPSVTSLGTTTSGSTAGGTQITISGSGFTGAGGVFFGSVPATSFTVNSDTSITATSPSQAAGTFDVTVITPTGTSAVSSSDQFTYTNASAPAVTGVSPGTGTTAGGITITITGSGFTGATAVDFGTAAASFTFYSDSFLTAVVPSQGAGLVNITVTTPSGTSTTNSNNQFTYTAAPGPAVSSVTPNTGSVAGGTLVVLVGSGFTGATAVNFGTTAASSFSVLDDTTLEAWAPAESAGTIDITVTTPSGTSTTTSADHYTDTTLAAPTVTGINPITGGSGGGTVVIVFGTGFTTASAVNFGNISAPTFIVNSDTQLTVVAPAQAAGTVNITVTAYAGTSSTSAADQFTYTAAPTPTVTGVTSNYGPATGGTNVTITGTNLQGASGVFFGSVAAVSYTINPDGSIFAVAPAESAGQVDITVTTPSGTSATGAADKFNFDPVLSSVTVNGANVTIAGQSVSLAGATVHGG